MVLAEVAGLLSEVGALEQDAHADEFALLSAAECRLLQPISVLVPEEDTSLVVWDYGHLLTPAFSVHDGLSLSEDAVRDKVLLAMQLQGIPPLVRRLVEVKRGQILFFYSHLPHAGVAGHKRNFRIFAALFPVDPTRHDLWYLVKPTNNTVALHAWFAENFLSGSQQHSRALKRAGATAVNNDEGGGASSNQGKRRRLGSK
jgi:hypothetical protein